MSTCDRTMIRVASITVCVWMSASLLFAQTAFKVGSKELQVHGAVQQGFAVTDTNNFLTMDTAEGSAAMTDAAVNVTSSLTQKLRVGGQLYVSNMGQLGNGRLQLDWAYADYRFATALGVRGGKMKTALGLFNDTQDMEFLYTWALLPQGTYPLDFRVATIAHVGGDVYGTADLGRAGSIAYTAYGGIIQDDPEGGYRYGVESLGIDVLSVHNTRTGGLDARWATPVNGLMTGYSFSAASLKVDVIVQPYGIPLSTTTTPWHRHAVYADYQRSGLRLSSEWRRERRDTTGNPANILPPSMMKGDAAFVAASYRPIDMVEVGSYYSYYVADLSVPSSDPTNHIYDKVVSGRLDLNRFWHVKVEGHFMDGVGPVYPLARGFYVRDNPMGMQPKTKMLVIRTGVNF